MSNEPKPEQRSEQPYVSIPIKATLREWGQVNALVEETLGWLGRNGTPPAGAPFFRHRVIGSMDEKFELEVGFPLAEPVPGDGRVVAGAKPAGTYVVLMHDGHPDGISNSHLELIRWAEGAGITLAKSDNAGTTVWEAMFESYLTNPDDEPDLNRWQTELVYLVSSTERASY